MTSVSNYVLFGGVIDNMTDSSSFIEFGTSILAGIIMFIVYFIVDVIYQARLCPKQTTEEDVSNSLYNSLNISLWVAAGYFIAYLIIS